MMYQIHVSEEYNPGSAPLGATVTAEIDGQTVQVGTIRGKKTTYTREAQVQSVLVLDTDSRLDGTARRMLGLSENSAISYLEATQYLIVADASEKAGLRHSTNGVRYQPSSN